MKLLGHHCHILNISKSLNGYFRVIENGAQNVVAVRFKQVTILTMMTHDFNLGHIVIVKWLHL